MYKYSVPWLGNTFYVLESTGWMICFHTESFDKIVFIETNLCGDSDVLLSYFLCDHVSLFCPVRFHLSLLRKDFYALPSAVLFFLLDLPFAMNVHLKLGLCLLKHLRWFLSCVNVLLFVHGGVVLVTHFMTCWTAFVFFLLFLLQIHKL